jgi:hypothetical protein
MSSNVTSYEVNLPDLTTSELLLDLLGQIDNKLANSIGAEAVARNNGDVALSSLITTLAGRVTVLEETPDVLTEGERRVIEEALDRLVKQEGFSSLIDGLNVTIGGVSFKAGSVIMAMLAARKIARHDYSNRVGYLHRTYSVTFTDGSISQLTALATELTAAELTTLLGRTVANDGAQYVFGTEDFGGVPAQFDLVYEHESVSVGGVTSLRPILVRKSNIVALLPGFTTAAPVILGGVDMTGDGVIGNPVVTPPADPVAAALVILNAALAAQVQADAAVVTAQDSVNAATVANTDAQATANAARSDAEAAVATATTAYTAAQVATAAAAAADADAVSDVATADQILIDAQATGDQAQIDAAQDSLAQYQAARAITAQALSTAQANETLAAFDYTIAIQSLNAINAAAAATSQTLADVLVGLAAAQQVAGAAATAVTDAQAVYNAALAG